MGGGDFGGSEREMGKVLFFIGLHFVPHFPLARVFLKFYKIISNLNFFLFFGPEKLTLAEQLLRVRNSLRLFRLSNSGFF